MRRAKINVEANHENSQESLKKELSRLVEENAHLENLIGFNSLQFKDVLIYCKKTIEDQDTLVRRLEDSIERNEKEYELKLKQQYAKIESEEKEFKSEIESLQTDNWLMKTRLETREELDQEVKNLKSQVENLQRIIEMKDEVISKTELKEREISILVAERTRKEFELEFHDEIQRIEKEVKIQNQAQILANNQIVKKMQTEIDKQVQEKEGLADKISKLRDELEAYKKNLEEAEAEKKKMENIIQRSNQQTEKLLKDSKRQLEESEKSRQKEASKWNSTINGLRKENSELKSKHGRLEKELNQVKMDLDKEQVYPNFFFSNTEFSKTRNDTLAKHSAQNARLEELREFLAIVLEENNDDYIDNIIGENRAAVFAKLSLLLQRIPIVE